MKKKPIPASNVAPDIALKASRAFMKNAHNYFSELPQDIKLTVSMVLQDLIKVILRLLTYKKY